MNITVPTFLRSFALTDFADITAAPVTSIGPGNAFGTGLIVFDDSTITITPAQVNQIYDRAASRNANEETIRGNARTAMTTNTTFLALGSPTQAQAVAQVQALSRQNNGIIRVLLNQLDGTT